MVDTRHEELKMRAAVLAAAAERMLSMFSGRTPDERELIDSILLKTAEVWRLVGYTPRDKPWQG